MNANIYTRLGVKTLINGQGTVTVVGGSLMPPEVVQAMAEAANWFVSIPELQEKVGARIAGLMGVPAAMVTAGAASSITVATAACMTWDNLPAIDRLPDTTGLKNEVVIQKGHLSHYEPQMLLTGAKLVWVENRAELDRAINPRTAMLFFLNRFEPLGQIKREEWIRVGKERGVPLFNDAAADVPPAARFSEYLHQGFDLVAFSGGKGLRGPQASGLLLGRPDLIAAGRRAISPAMGIGRAMKVGKEEIVGLLAAVERFLKLDHDAEWRIWETRVSEMLAQLADIPGMNARREVAEIANHVPQVVLEWSQWHSKRTAEEVVQMLWEGDPRIAVLAEGQRRLRIMVWTLRDDEHRIVARRIQEIFKDVTVLNWTFTETCESNVTCRAPSWSSLGATPLLRLDLERFDLVPELLGLASRVRQPGASSSAMVWAWIGWTGGGLGFLVVQGIERLLKHATGKAAETAGLMSELGLERRVCLLDPQRSDGAPGPEPHGPVGIADQGDEDVLQRRVVLGQTLEMRRWPWIVEPRAGHIDCKGRPARGPWVRASPA